MKIRSSYLLAFGICIAAGVWIITGVNLEQDTITAAPKITANQSQPFAVRVRSSVAERREDVTHVLGHTQASRRIELHAEVDGRVSEVIVERGANVTASTVIAKLAMDDRKARLTEARALINQYQDELEATRTLASKGNRAALDVTAAQARLESARAMVTRIEIEIARTEIRAPFAGVVESRIIELGSYLRVGDAIATLVDLDPIKIVGHLTEREALKVSLGNPAQARLLDGRIVAGRIVYIATAADPTTRTFRVEIEAPNPPTPKGRMIEGLTTELMIPIGSIVAHRITPAIISLNDDGRLGLKIVNNEKIAEFVPVRIVATSPDAMWVEGLPERITLISVGHDFVNSGQRVRAVPE